MTLEEAIKNFEQEIGEFEGLKKIHAVTNEDYEYIEKARQLAEWLKELKERREKDVPDINVGSNGDAIYRQDAIDAVDKLSDEPIGYLEAAIDALVDLPSAQSVLDRTKISNLLEKIYSIQSVHLSVEGVIARKYYCKQLWMELFGSEDVPTWMI